MSKSSDQEELSAAIASIAGALAAELQQSSSPPFVDPNADLNAAYGIDSLARVELISRIEKQFGARLPEADAIRAATAAEMAHLLQRSLDPAGTSKFRGASKQIHTPLDAAQEPAGASTLLDVLDWHVQHAPERNHVIFEEEENSAVALTYGELRQSASRFAAGLHHAGVEPQTAVALMLPTGLDFLISFFGCLLAGTVPVPLYPPFQHTQLEEHLRRNLATLSNCRASAMIVFPEIHTAARLARFALPGLSLISTPEEILSGPTTAIQRKAAAEQPAFIQYTSGSTSSPKGVVLSHGNLLANIRAMGQACGVRQGDVFASWLPLYHDMGLIGAWFGSLYYGIPLVLMSPLSFIAHPERWLRAIDRFRATISGGPNFAYQLCASRLDSEKLAGLNLSSWRIAFNGAEPVSANTITAFCRRFAPYEFKPEAVLPVYGLAENCVGLCFPPPGRGARIETVSRTKLQLHGIAERIPPEDPDAYASVSCGRPLLGHQLRIIDTEGNEMPERHVGQLQFQGPSATRGYFDNPQANARLFDGRWLNSGDYAYLADGEVFVAGRMKDVIIRGGRNIYPQDIEEAVGTLPGVRKGCVCAWAALDTREGTEKLVVAAETRLTREDEKAVLRTGIQRTVAALVEFPPDEVLLLPPRSLLKTSSGKIRRSGCRELYERGELGRTKSSAVQWLAFFADLLVSAAQYGIRKMRGGAYCAWAYLLLGIFGCAAVLLVSLLPSIPLRRRALHVLGIWLFRLAGVRLEISGLEPIANGAARIITANHASYADVLVLTAALPPVFACVAKKEFARNPAAHFLFARIGTLFVERFSAEESISDAEVMIQAVNQGSTVLIFPEGTFCDASNMLPFKLGAFTTAARTGAAILPVAVSGTRKLLRPEQWFVRRTAVRVTGGTLLKAQDAGWDAVLALRNAAFQEIERLMHRPD